MMCSRSHKNDTLAEFSRAKNINRDRRSTQAISIADESQCDRPNVGEALCRARDSIKHKRVDNRI